MKNCALGAMVTMVAVMAGCSLVPSPVDLPGTSDLTGTGSTSSASTAKACADGKEFAKAQCDRSQRCATNQDYWFMDLGTGEQCEHWVASWYVGIFALTGKDDRVDQCEKELNAPECGATPACESLGRDRRREEGVECSSTSDCKVGLTCIDDKCATRKSEGAKCNESDACNDGLSCQDGKCKTVVEGETKCHTSEDCEVTRDSEGYGFFFVIDHSDRFVCDDATLTCKSVVRDRKKGETCGEGRLCVSGLYCKGRLLNGEGTCTPQIAYGEPCDGIDGCPTCSNGICKDPLEGTCN